MPTLATTPNPIEAAVSAFSRRAGVAAPLRSAGWDEMATGLRQQAYWSAGVEHARFLSQSRAKLLQALSGQRKLLDSGESVNMDRSRFVRDMRRLVQGARSSGQLPAGAGPNPLTDIGDATRLRLVYDMNTRMAQGEARWRRQQDPDVLNMWPAQELMPSSATHPRTDWEERWFSAAQESGDIKAGEVLDETGRMVALKTSGIWVALSRFGVPWPPFDYGSQRRLRSVDRDEAVELGLLEADSELQPVDEQFDRNLAASVKDIDPETRQALKSVFLDQIEIDGDTVTWNPDAYEDPGERDRSRAAAQAGYAGAQESVRELRDLREAVHRDPALARFVDEQWPVEISAVVSGRKPLFHEAIGQAEADSLAAVLRQHLPSTVEVRVSDGELFVYRPDQWKLPFSEIRKLGDSGRALGYGANLFEEPTVRVSVIDASGNKVAGFHVPTDKANIFATARTKDWTDATGRPHSYRLESA